MNKYDLTTPALLIDIDALEHNIQLMADYFKAAPASLRPHFKTHKMPVIAHMQLAAGAIGIACQNLQEAGIAAQAGIRNILVTNQIASAEQVRQFVSMSRWADVTVGIDSIDVAQQISKAAVAEGVTAKVAVEISMIRCGIHAGMSAVDFVKQLVRLKGIKFMGLWTHEAGASESFELGMEKSWDKRKEAHYAALDMFLETKHMIEKAGIPVGIFSAGYTATYDMTALYPEITDVQAGSYVFMDWPYRQLEGLDKFQQALSVLTTIISIPPHQKNKAYADCGTKSISYEHTCDYTLVAFPKIKGVLGSKISVTHLSEEHAHLEGEVSRLKVGEKIELIPSHCCTTCSRYNRAYVVSGDKVFGVWNILARDTHG